jgi:hypothetical protein
MKSHTIGLPRYEAYEKSIGLNWLSGLDVRLRQVARMILASIPAAALLIALVWAIGISGGSVYLQASAWALGFVFLGLALDSEKMGELGLHILSALALFALTWLSKSQGLELLVVAGAIPAIRLSVALFRRLS